MSRRSASLAGLALWLILLTGCSVVSATATVVSTAVSVTATVVETTVDVAAAGVSAALPDDDDEEARED